MKDFIDLHYSSVYSAITRLTRLPDQQEVEILTQNVLADLWRRKDEFSAENYQGVFLYKLILYHIFSYLKEQGDEARIVFLRKTLPIHPGSYTSILGEQI